MAQPDNLLSIVVTGKPHASARLAQCRTLAAGGDVNFRTTLQRVLADTAQQDIAQTAKETLTILAGIAKRTGVTREAIGAVLATLTEKYRRVMAEVETAVGIQKKTDPRHEQARAYKQLHANCQAYAGAILPALEARIAEHNASHGANAAAADAAADDSALFQAILDVKPAPTAAGKAPPAPTAPAAPKAPPPAKAVRKPTLAADAFGDARIAPTLSPTQNAAPAKPAQPQKTAPQSAKKPA
ncbi:MAG: hypothetical protein PHX87_02400 [Candidatus Peribacteraceae bacterium]|nr:hypothetical protein [Candidatus Peribacteraceae bacterium]MDD5742258.1 hypothetical protein [Candidatus Peribacteraceae bacterium]